MRWNNKILEDDLNIIQRLGGAALRFHLLLLLFRVIFFVGGVKVDELQVHVSLSQGNNDNKPRANYLASHTMDELSIDC